MSDTKVRARKAKPSAAAPTVDIDSLINEFDNKEADTSYVNELARKRLTPAQRAAIYSVEVRLPKEEEITEKTPSFAVIKYKTGGSKTMSLVSPTCFTLRSGKLNVKTLEYVHTTRGGKHYLNLDGKPLTPTE